jgi:hypothetical protein
MKEQKNTQGVMVNVINDVKLFIGEVEDYKITPIYSDLFKSIKDKVEQLAALEELILQQRCMNPDGKIKLSLLREYVYARCPFYRRDKSTKDIRVLIGRTDLLDPTNQNPTLDDLYNNQDVMRTALTKLLTAMKYEFVAKSEVYFKMYD